MNRPDRHSIRWSRWVLSLSIVLLVAGCGSSGGRQALEEEKSAPEPQPGAGSQPSPSTTAPPGPSHATPTLPSTTEGPAGATTAAEEPEDGVTVLSVTDGDTLRVLVEGENEPLRLIGINAPERGECMAAEASARLAELVGAGSVRLERDVSDRDDFGRLLRYVYAGDVFVNERLVREGLALARRYQPDTSRSDTLEAAQAAAEEEGVGMWDPTACGEATQARIQIGGIHPDAAGDDNANLNDEWVELTNTGETAIDLTGWSVRDESASHRYRFPPDFHLGGGTTVRLHTGCGQDTSTALYWCNQGSAVWNNSGDTVFVLDPNGNVVVSESYSG